MTNEVAANRKHPVQVAFNRKQALTAIVEDGRLVVSIGIDALTEFLSSRGRDSKRIGAGDIADYLTATWRDGMPPTPIEEAIVSAFDRAAVDDEELPEPEPSTEFFR